MLRAGKSQSTVQTSPLLEATIPPYSFYWVDMVFSAAELRSNDASSGGYHLSRRSEDGRY